jgi:hypothetical protein
MEVLSATFRSAAPLSQGALGPEALRPSITTGLPFSNEWFGFELFKQIASLLSPLLIVIYIDLFLKYLFRFCDLLSENSLKKFRKI